MSGRRVLVATSLAILAACSKSDKSSPSSPENNEAPPTQPSPSASGDGTGPAAPASALPGPFVAAGLSARLVAVNVAGLRQIAFAPNSDLFGVTAGSIWLFRDGDGDGSYAASEIHEWAQTGGNGNNAHLDVASGFLYAGTPTGVKRFAYVAGALTAGASEDVVVGQTADGHQYHTTHVYDGWLYVHSGSSGNVSHESGDGAPDYDTKRSLIKRFQLSSFVSGSPFSWDSGQVVVQGIRNNVGFGRNELTGKIYGVVNGVDQLAYKGANVHIDNPGEQVVEIALGKKYGYPFCFTAQRVFDGGDTGALIPPGTQLVNVGFTGNPHDDAWCAANSTPPTTFIQAHSAPLDIVFFDKQPKGNLPERWRGGAFVALHGSWNRETFQTGYKVVWIPFKADGTAPMPTSTATTTTFPYEVVFGGGKDGVALDGPWTWSEAKATEPSVRPVGVAVSPIDGALFVSSDTSGMLYRIGSTAK
jgi:glucose/arabinose dehydrogenase